MLAALLLGSRPAVPQTPARTLDTYLGVIAAYRAGGDMERAVGPLQTWSKKEFENAIAALILRRDISVIEAAAILHLEFGLAAIGRSLTSAETHLELGWRLMRVLLRPDEYHLPQPPDLPVLASTWLAVAATGYLSINDAVRGKPWLRLAIDIAPRSAILHTYWGAGEELEAMAIYPLRSNDEPFAAAARRSTDLRRRLLTAAASYRKAIELDAKYATPHLRLGRILQLTGDLGQAQAELEQARALATEPVDQFQAHLVLGAVLQERKDLAGARASYERALAIAPQSQSGTAALGYLDVLTGRPDLAQKRVAQFVAAPADDPYWWEIRNGGFYRAGLAWLRERATR